MQPSQLFIVAERIIFSVTVNFNDILPDIVGVTDTTVLCVNAVVPEEEGGCIARQYTTFKHPYHTVIKTYENKNIRPRNSQFSVTELHFNKCGFFQDYFKKVKCELGLRLVGV